jgi:hypothetical protein
LQAAALTANGEDFTVHAGSCPVHTTNPKQANSRELNASPDEIKKTLTSLTAGIATQVNFYAMEDTAGAAPRLKFEVWNVTDGAVVGSAKNETLDSVFPKLYVSQTFTPVAGKTYEARVSWTSGTGKGLFHHVQWFAKGDEAVWTRWTSADDEPTHTVFGSLARPKTWYYQVRMRVSSRVAGHRCYSAWTAWTTPINPGHDAMVGPPPPTGVTQVIDKVEGVRRAAWRVRTRWNELPWWTPPDSDAREGADRYVVQLAVSSQSDGTPLLNTRTVSIPADDADVGVLAKKDWLYRILGKRYYRSRVAAVVDGRRGAFSAWTAWASPGGAPNPPTGLTWSNPNRSTLVARWTEPADPTDVDRYKVEVIRASDSAVVDTVFTSSTRHTYHIPKADRDVNHRVRVRSIEDPGTLDEDDTPVGWDTGDESSTATSSDVADTAIIIGELRNNNDKPMIRKTGFPRCKVTYAAGDNLPTATDLWVRFGTEVVDTDNFHPTTTGNVAASPDSTYDITLPFDGQYLLLYRATFEAGTGHRHLMWRKNGVGGERITQMAVSGATAHRMEQSTMIDGVEADTLQVGVFQSSGVGLILSAAALSLVYMGDA